MALKYNNTTVNKVMYGNTEIKEFNVNGIEVFNAKKPYEDYLNSSTISESDFLDKVNTTDVFDDINPSTNLPYAKDFIGKRVRLTHPYRFIYWAIIGYNHDSTRYTFDLMSSVSMYDSEQFAQTSRNYINSKVRTKVNNDMIDGFSSEVQSKLQAMNVVSNGSTLKDKAKLLSLTEMGITSGNYHPGVEGNAYSNYFTSGRSTEQTYSDLIRKNTSGTAVGYWTRSICTAYDYTLWSINSEGWVNYNVPNNYSRSILPVIRIGTYDSK